MLVSSVNFTETIFSEFLSPLILAPTRDVDLDHHPRQTVPLMTWMSSISWIPCPCQVAELHSLKLPLPTDLKSLDPFVYVRLFFAVQVPLPLLLSEEQEEGLCSSSPLQSDCPCWSIPYFHLIGSYLGFHLSFSLSFLLCSVDQLHFLLTRSY